MNTPDTPDPALAQPLSDDDFERLESILDDLAERSDDIHSSWEYCDGFLTALICGRRLLAPSSTSPCCLAANRGMPRGLARRPSGRSATSALSLWMRRWNEIAAALQAPVETLDDERTLQALSGGAHGVQPNYRPRSRSGFKRPWRRAAAGVCAYWAVGFWDVVQAWPDDWRTPRDRGSRARMEDALMAIAA